MDESVFWFCFNDTVDMSAVEEVLLMAVIATEGMHGRARVGLEAKYAASPEERTCTITADNEVGQSIARIFNEMLNLELGEDVFQVRRHKARGPN